MASSLENVVLFLSRLSLNDNRNITGRIRCIAIIESRSPDQSKHQETFSGTQSWRTSYAMLECSTVQARIHFMKKLLIFQC